MTAQVVPDRQKCPVLGSPDKRVKVVYDKKKFEWHFGDLLTFSNTCGRLLVEFID